MALDQGAGGSRPLRADARRNRDAILLAARGIFETEGVLALLDGIAIRAGGRHCDALPELPHAGGSAVMDSSIIIAQAQAVGLEHSSRAALA